MSPATAPRLALLSITLPVLALWPGIRRPRTTVLVLVLWTALASLWSSSPPDAVWGTWMVVLLALAIALGEALAGLRQVWLGAGLGLVMNLPFVMFQFHIGQPSWSTMMQVAPPAGLFVNKNMLAEAAAVVLAGAVAARMWPLVALSGYIVVVTECRGAIAGLGLAALAWVWRRSRVTACSLGLGCALTAALWLALASPGLSTTVRLAMWLETTEHLSILGAGTGSFYHDFPMLQSALDTIHARPLHVHNDYLELIYELGTPGLVAILALAWACRGAPLSVLAPLLTLAGSAAFAMPWRNPATLLLGGLLLGHAMRLGTGLRGVSPLGRVGVSPYPGPEPDDRGGRPSRPTGSPMVPLGTPLPANPGRAI